MTDLEQIALRVAPRKSGTLESHTYSFVDDAALVAYARRLVAALGAQEPIGTVVDGLTFNWTDTNTKWSIPKGTKLYAAPIPSTCPVCTQKIDDEAKAGRIVDDRIPDGWPTEEMIEKGAEMFEATLHSAADFKHHAYHIFSAMLAAAPEYRK